MFRVIDCRNSLPTGPVGARGSAGPSEDAQQALNSHAIAFITCVNDETQYDICIRYLDALQIPSGYVVERIAVLGAPSMAEGYQRALEASTARYKIYLHQDVYVVHRGLLAEVIDLFRTYPRLGMIGVHGATRLPVSGMWWEKNRLYCYGRLVEFLRPPQGFPASLFRPPNLRRLQLVRFQSCVGDYLPAVAVDGVFMATQYDIPWANSLGGFELYDQVQSLAFIKVGLELGIARQQAIWFIHWGPILERTPPRGIRRQTAVDQRAALFRQLYPAFLDVSARKLYEQHRGAAERPSSFTGVFGNSARGFIAMQADFKPSEPSREQLGVIIVALNCQEVLVRALRALLPQCEALKEIEWQVVVVNNSSTNTMAEGVHREFPRVTVIGDGSNGGPAHGFNMGLRHLGFPSYVLVMHDDVKVSPGTLAKMVSYLREHESTAGVVASIIDPDGTVQPQRTAIVALLPRRPRRSQRVTFVSTAFALVRGEVFFDVGLYDERFHSCHADLDWSIRAKRKGHGFTYLPEVRVIHHRSVDASRNQPGVVADRLVANLWYAYKHAGPRWAVAVYLAQRFRVRWVAFRWRNDGEALGQLNEAMVWMDDFYRRLRGENRMPQMLAP